MTPRENAETRHALLQKCLERLNVANEKGFPMYVRLQLMVEVTVAMADSQLACSELVINTSKLFNEQIAQIRKAVEAL